MRKGDEVLRIGDRNIQTWTDVRFALALAGLDRERVPVQVRNADGDTLTRTLDLTKLPAEFDELQAPTLVGLTARYQLEPPIVDDIVPGSPAYGVLAENDRILAIDGQPVADYADIAPAVKALAARGGPGMIEVLRKEGDAESRRTQGLPAHAAHGHGRRRQARRADRRHPQTVRQDAGVRRGAPLRPDRRDPDGLRRDLAQGARHRRFHGRAC